MEDRAHADLVRKPTGRVLEAWRQFKVFLPVKMGAQTEDVADTRRALTWEEVEGQRTGKAR